MESHDKKQCNLKHKTSLLYYVKVKRDPSPWTLRFKWNKFLNSTDCLLLLHMWFLTHRTSNLNNGSKMEEIVQCNYFLTSTVVDDDTSFISGSFKLLGHLLPKSINYFQITLGWYHNLFPSELKIFKYEYL